MKVGFAPGRALSGMFDEDLASTRQPLLGNLGYPLEDRAPKSSGGFQFGQLVLRSHVHPWRPGRTHWTKSDSVGVVPGDDRPLAVVRS